MERQKIIIEDVPAFVCVHCGESYFDSETTLRMEEIKKVSEEKQKINFTFKKGE